MRCTHVHGGSEAMGLVKLGRELVHLVSGGASI